MELMKDLLREEVEGMEKEIEKLETKLQKEVSDISMNKHDRIRKTMSEIEKIRYAQTKFYEMLGKM